VETSEPRVRLSRDLVLKTAVQIADDTGIESLTMRRLGEKLGAEAMSLYYHVANKEQVLDGVADVIASEINDTVASLHLPAEWKAGARKQILAARKVFLRHKWAPAVFVSRTNTSPEVMRYYDGLVGLMRNGGLSNDLIHHSLHALGSRALGFNQELFDPGGGPAPAPTAEMLDQMAGTLPHLAGMLREVAHDDPESTLGWCDDQYEFEFGLDLILDGLDRLAESGERADLD
jgi:AcrR family transcriptional regulator